MEWIVWLGLLALLVWALRFWVDNTDPPKLANRVAQPVPSSPPPSRAAIQVALLPVQAGHSGSAAKRDETEAFMSLYSLRTRFFSRTEGAFYRALLRAVSPRYFVFAKVRLLDICNNIPGGDYSAMNRIAKKHVDFLLCDPATFAPVAAIEVDGSSHERADRIERDAFVNALFVRIGLPLIRVPAASWFEPADVLQRIELATSLN